MKFTFEYFNRACSQIGAHGIGLLAERYGHRPRILFTRPLACPATSKLEVHLQVCARDWLNAIWTLKSFSYYVEQPFRLVLLHDGSLKKQAIRWLAVHFPGAIWVDNDQIRSLIDKRIRSSAPTLADMRVSGNYCTLSKIVDSTLLARNSTIIVLDPDVVFFAPPLEIVDIEGLGNNFALLNTQVGKSSRDGFYCFDCQEVEDLLGISLPYNFATGLGLVNVSLVDFNLYERALSELHLPDRLRFMVDQTLLAMSCAQHGYKELDPKKYAIEPVSSLSGVVARHYYSKTRDLMYVEGVRELRGRGMLVHWSQPVSA